MRVPSATPAHLTYCTNIHPGETWPEVRANLERYVLAVRMRVAPGQRFGVGLRLSAVAAAQLSQPHELQRLAAFLDEHALYVFTINGFPYGDFHGVRVKENVYRPDWLEEPRLLYSDQLADILAALLPDGGDLYGSVSTVPVAWRPRAADAAVTATAVELLVRHVTHLARIYERSGKVIVLALEPEPGCLLETSHDAAVFFEERLFRPPAIHSLARQLGRSDAAAEDAMRLHVGACFDACHAAVEFEAMDSAVDNLMRAGVRIAKIQLSAGLRVAHAGAETLARLREFADDLYLHQVVRRRADGHLLRHSDLPEALAAAGEASPAGDEEWRVHFHVPLHREQLGPFAGTQPFLRELLARQHRAGLSGHLEVETYTWSVLPREFRGADVVEDVTRELEWVLHELAG